jgi:HEAT repeat protein
MSHSGRLDSAGNGRGGENLSCRQEQVALLLVAGASEAAAARQTKVGERTIRTWKREVPAFGRRVAALRGELTQRAAGVLVRGMIEAAWTLRKLLRSKSERVRLRASDALLTHGGQMNAVEKIVAELRAEVEELKAILPRRRR